MLREKHRSHFPAGGAQLPGALGTANKGGIPCHRLRSQKQVSGKNDYALRRLFDLLERGLNVLRQAQLPKWRGSFKWQVEDKVEALQTEYARLRAECAKPDG